MPRPDRGSLGRQRGWKGLHNDQARCRLSSSEGCHPYTKVKGVKTGETNIHDLEGGGIVVPLRVNLPRVPRVYPDFERLWSPEGFALFVRIHGSVPAKAGLGAPAL